MKIIISPASNMKTTSQSFRNTSTPIFIKKAKRLAHEMRRFHPFELESLLSVSDERAFKIFDYYQNFETNEAFPALYFYHGAAYRSICPEDFSEDDIRYSTEYLRILSALYGILRPMDEIKPYRLGMTCDFSVGGKNIYRFWDEDIYRELFTGEPVLNLSSNEYAKLFLPFLKKKKDSIVTCRFLVKKKGAPPRGTVSTVRTARGLMTRFLIKNKITRPEDAKNFDLSGYQYAPALSTESSYAFVLDKVFQESIANFK